MRAVRAALWLCALAALAACSRSSEDLNDTKRMPKPPPPESTAAPRALHVAVVVDGVEAGPFDAAKLDATPPDFADAERRAWRIESLVGPAATRAGAVISVTGDKGVSIVLRHADPGAGAGRPPVPVLVVTRRGEVVAAMIEPDDPFPAYHGRGGRLGRRGDALPRIAGVTRIRVAAAEPTPAGVPPAPGSVPPAPGSVPAPPTH